MPTYNHASFVAEAIASVLRQRDVAFELLIADDGSQDATRDVVASIADPRIHFTPCTVNRGACVVTNELIRRARGEFVALINSDDFWTDDYKLSHQLDVLRAAPELGACFGKARFVDKDGRPIEKSALPFGTVFDQGNRSRGAWLRHFFDRGNCICHPTMLIRRECYATVGLYDNSLRQLPDFDMWVRLIKKYDIHVSDREMIAFRQLPGENASSATSENLRRILNETYFILLHFFDGASPEIVAEGFSDLLTQENLADEVIFAIETALVYLQKDRWAAHIYSFIGLQKVYSMLQVATHRDVLKTTYQIDDRTFHRLLAEHCVFDRAMQPAAISTVTSRVLLTELTRRLTQRLPHCLQPLARTFLQRTTRQ